jgi:tetratricopeptide (TPR) repeat protein
MRTRLFVAVVATAAGCVHVPTEREMRAADNHFDLGVIQQKEGTIQEALKEYNAALALNERFPEAHNALAILLHISFNKQDDAIKHYKRALELRPVFSEAKTNLANVYLDQGKYDDAIKLYDEALNDMLYPTPYIAHSNRGWALYKKGDVKGGVESIQIAVTTNPKFCLGYKNLGLIHDDQGKTEEACTAYGRYKDSCPNSGDAYFREGVCMAKLGKTDEAKKDFAACQAKADQPAMKDDCKRLYEQLQ